jgi:hypothetical protein
MGTPRALTPNVQIKRMQSRANDGPAEAQDDALNGRQLSISLESEKRSTNPFEVTARIFPKPESDLPLGAG